MKVLVQSALAIALCFVSPAVAFDPDALYTEADAAYEAKDYAKALSKMTSLAALGDVRAQNYVGYMHALAKGTIKDPEKAAQWYCRAALQGNAKSMANIARFYVDGTWVKPDPKNANTWYARSAVLGDPLGQVNLGMNHLDGEGTAEDPVQAYTWLSIALQGRPGETLAHEYLLDAEKALSPKQISDLKADIKNWKPESFSDDLKADIANSALCKSLDLDMKPLIFNKGAEALRYQNFDLAHTLFKVLADDDHVKSQIILAEMFESGQGRGVDHAQANAWYCRAAAQGDQEALWRLAARSASEAEIFHKVGANLGDARAQLSLGRQMMSSDPVQAYKWLSVASNENLDESGEAEELFEKIRAQVTQEQKIQGINLAADFWPVQPTADMAKVVQSSKTCRALL